MLDHPSTRALTLPFNFRLSARGPRVVARQGDKQDEFGIDIQSALLARHSRRRRRGPGDTSLLPASRHEPGVSGDDGRTTFVARLPVSSADRSGTQTRIPQFPQRPGH